MSQAHMSGELSPVSGLDSLMVICGRRAFPATALFLETVHLGPRMSFQRWWASRAKEADATILNIGCADDPAGLGARGYPPGLNTDVTHFDFDWWDHPKFIQGDAHDLLAAGIGDRSYDMVIMADIHEHLVDPLKATLEAARVARRWLVMTIFEEWRLPGHGQFIEEGLVRADAETAKAGYDSYEQFMARTYPQALVVSDSVQAHHFHINQFEDTDISALVDGVIKLDKAWTPRAYFKCPEQVQDGHQWYNWLIALERVGG